MSAMAIATDAADRPTPDEAVRAPRDGDEESRSRAFERARRHSMLVRWLKRLLPAAAALVMSSYALFLQHSISVGDGKLTLGPVTFSTEQLTMHNPRYEGFNKDGSRYLVTARTAEQEVKQQDAPIRLNTIDGRLVQPNNTVTTLSAVRGNFDNKAQELELFEAIEIKSSDGTLARLTRAKVFMKESRIVSDEPVSVETPTGTLRGNSMVLLQKTRETTFSGGVAAHLKPQAGTTKEAQTGGLLGRSDAPVDITAPALFVDDARKRAVFSEDVRAEQEGSTLTARELEVLYDGDTAVASTAGVAGGGRLTRLIARDNVVLTRASDRATAASAEFDALADTSVLSGGVVITSGQDRQAVGDRAELDHKSDTALLTGAVLVTQGKNWLKGRRLLVDRKSGTMQLSAPAEAGAAAGRINARFYQTETKPQKPEAAEAEGLGWRFRTDPNAPIDIDADVLDVDDTARTATFRGAVRAIQGEFTIRTVEMIATYTGQAGISLMQAAPTTGSKPAAAQIQRVQARKKVLVTSKDDQSATGDWADFDVKSNTVTIGGDVVLTQGPNVVRGPKLVIDMVTGLSRMESARPAVAAPDAPGLPPAPGGAAGSATAGAGGHDPGACRGRMCAVFYPKDAKSAMQQGLGAAATGSPAKEPRTKGKAPENSEPTATSGWSSTTTTGGGQ